MYSKSLGVGDQVFFVGWMDERSSYLLCEWKGNKKAFGCLERLYVESEKGVLVNRKLTHHQLRLLCSKVHIGRVRWDLSMVQTLIKKEQARNKAKNKMKRCMHGDFFCGFGRMWML